MTHHGPATTFPVEPPTQSIKDQSIKNRVLLCVGEHAEYYITVDGSPVRSRSTGLVRRYLSEVTAFRAAKLLSRDIYIPAPIPALSYEGPEAEETPTCSHGSVTACHGDGAYCRHCGETLA